MSDSSNSVTEVIKGIIGYLFGGGMIALLTWFNERRKLKVSDKKSNYEVLAMNNEQEFKLSSHYKEEAQQLHIQLEKMKAENEKLKQEKMEIQTKAMQDRELCQRMIEDFQVKLEALTREHNILKLQFKTD